MNIDGKEGVKEKREIQRTRYFITYRYIFENGNYYNESKPNWTQTDFGTDVKQSPEDAIERHIDKLINRR